MSHWVWSRVTSSSSQTVFVHSGWRCSSTYVWSKFRQLDGVRAYYEPWHEQLERLNAQTLNVETPDNSGLRHPGGSRPYLGEFAPVLDPAGGVLGYQDRFALDRYFLDPDDEDLDQQAYLEGLIAAARERDEAPVLACCRTLGRIDWLRRRFDGFHIVLIRDPVQQWMSFYSLRRRPRPTYFELCQYLILSELPGRDAQAQALLGRRFSRKGRLAERIAAVRRRLKRADAKVSFAAFMAVYLLSYLRALPQADLVIDVDRMARDRDYARSVEAAIRQASGLTPDFSDCRTPERHDLAPVPFRAMARAVVSDLDLKAAIASRESLLLYGKLANTFALLPSQAPSAADRWVAVIKGWMDGLGRKVALQAVGETAGR